VVDPTWHNRCKLSMNTEAFPIRYCMYRYKYSYRLLLYMYITNIYISFKLQTCIVLVPYLFNKYISFKLQTCIVHLLFNKFLSLHLLLV
jgi:hypothetical protein